MNSATFSLSLQAPKRKGVPQNKKDPALDFLDSIESTWKGHEHFAIWLVQELHPKTIVDLGFDRGLSTLAFGLRNRGNVFGIDWFDEGNYALKSFALDTAFRNISNAIRFNYAKNIHLIIGPMADVSRKWSKSIDILHIDFAHTYFLAKQRYEHWAPFVKADGLILFHDVAAFKEETGRFFRELPSYKLLFPHAQGLGLATRNVSLIEGIQRQFPDVRVL